MVTLSDHYGVRGVYCQANRTIGAIPPALTAVSTGGDDDTNNISGSTSLDIQFLLIGFSCLIGVFLAF